MVITVVLGIAIASLGLSLLVAKMLAIYKRQFSSLLMSEVRHREELERKYFDQCERFVALEGEMAWIRRRLEQIAASAERSGSGKC